jgi:uncharacterized protein (TIGR02391 family)
MTNSIKAHFQTAEELLGAPDRELERVLLRYVALITQDKMRRMATRDGTVTELFGLGGYEYSKKSAVEKRIGRAWKALENADLIEEPDPDNGKNGFRVVSEAGRTVNTDANFAAAMLHSRFRRDMFHASLPDAAWNAFQARDYDTAVFEAFKWIEISVRKKGGFAETDYGVRLMQKAFDPNNGPLRDKAATKGRREARLKLFEGAFGELRNPKAHQDPKITDPLVAVEEMMTAGALQRIVETA